MYFEKQKFHPLPDADSRAATATPYARNTAKHLNKLSRPRARRTNRRRAATPAVNPDGRRNKENKKMHPSFFHFRIIIKVQLMQSMRIFLRIDEDYDDDNYRLNDERRGGGRELRMKGYP